MVQICGEKKKFEKHCRLRSWLCPPLARVFSGYSEGGFPQTYLSLAIAMHKQAQCMASISCLSFYPNSTPVKTVTLYGLGEGTSGDCTEPGERMSMFSRSRQACRKIPRRSIIELSPTLETTCAVDLPGVVNKLLQLARRKTSCAPHHWL